MESKTDQNTPLPPAYRGPDKWQNAANEASSWGLLTAIPAAIYTIAPVLKASSTQAMKPIISSMWKRALISTGIVAGVELVAGYFGYKKAATAENDYNRAVKTVNDLTLENETLKAEKKWATRELERREPPKNAESVER